MITNLTDINKKAELESFIKKTYGCLADKRKVYWPSEDIKIRKNRIGLQKKKLKRWL